jgi:hypothetical protein
VSLRETLNSSPGFIPALIDRLDCLHQQDSQIIHRARADAAVMEGTSFTNAGAVVLQVRLNPVAAHFMDGIDDLWKMHLDPALFSQWSTRRTVTGPLDTTAANLLAYLVHVLGEFAFGDHNLPPVYPVSNPTKRLNTMHAEQGLFQNAPEVVPFSSVEMQPISAQRLASSSEDVRDWAL